MPWGGLPLRNILLANLKHGTGSKKSSRETIIIIRYCVDGCLLIGGPATGAVFLGKNGFNLQLQKFFTEVLITLGNAAEQCLKTSPSLSWQPLNVCVNQSRGTPATLSPLSNTVPLLKTCSYL